MMCFNPKFHRGHFSALDHGLFIIHGVVNSFIAQIRTLVMSFERSLSMLSENQKIVKIGSTDFKLWQLKESPNH